MTFPLAALVALLAARAEPFRSPYPEPYPAVAGRFPGTFASVPVQHFAVALPGRGASRTERARPVIAGSVILVGSVEGDALYMLDRTSGTLLRTFPASAPVESEPLVVGEHVFFGDTGGRVWAYKLTGEALWSYDTAAPVLVRPTLDDGRVFVTNVDDLVVALDAVEGRMLWRHKQRTDVTRRAELALYAAPPAVVSGGSVYVGFHDGTLVALATATGDPRWTLPVGEGRYPDLVAAPTVADGVVFASGYFEPLVAIDETSHQVLWQLPHGAADEAPIVPIASGPALLHPGTDGKLRAIRPRTGDLIWTWDSGDSSALLSPVATELGLLVGSTTGSLSVVDPDDGATIWRYAPGFVIEGLSAAPFVEGRQAVFATAAGRLYSLLAPTTPRPWPVLAPRTKKPKAVADR